MQHHSQEICTIGDDMTATRSLSELPGLRVEVEENGIRMADMTTEVKLDNAVVTFDDLLTRAMAREEAGPGAEIRPTSPSQVNRYEVRVPGQPPVTVTNN